MRTLSIWPAIVSAAASVLFHSAHAALMLAAAGAAGLHAHNHHAHGAGTQDPYGWLLWLGWGINALSIALCIALFTSYLRRRRDNHRAAASHLTACLVTFAIVAATTVWSLL